MKRIIFNTITLSIICGLAVSCSVGNDGSDCSQDFTGALSTNEEKLVGEWVLTGIDADEALDITDDDEDNPSTDLFAQYNECQKDAAYTFSSNRSYLLEQGQNGTNCPNKGIFDGTWQLSGNTLSFVDACITQNVALTFNGDDTSFMFSNNFTLADVNGNVEEVTIVFTYSIVL